MSTFYSNCPTSTLDIYAMNLHKKNRHNNKPYKERINPFTHGNERKKKSL